jgi:hypothetical protein
VPRKKKNVAIMHLAHLLPATSKSVQILKIVFPTTLTLNPFDESKTLKKLFLEKYL